MALSDDNLGAEAQQRLRLMAAAVEQVSNSVEIAEARGLRLIYVNPAFTRLTGYTAEEALGRTPAELLRSDRHEPAFWDAIDAAIWAGAILAWPDHEPAQGRPPDPSALHHLAAARPRRAHHPFRRHPPRHRREDRADAALRASEARLAASWSTRRSACT